MPDDGVDYETKVVQAIRGTEKRARDKWENDGWELAEQDEGMLRTKLTFRRPKKKLARWVWIAAAAGVAVLASIIVIGTVTENNEAPAPTATEAESTTEPDDAAEPEPSAEPTTEAPVTPTETAPPVEPAPEAAPIDENVTATGLEYGWATTACNNIGESQFPYGFDGHTIIGMINSEVQGDNYFLKYLADVTNEFGAEREATVDCTVTGTNESPIPVSFYVY